MVLSFLLFSIVFERIVDTVKCFPQRLQPGRSPFHAAGVVYRGVRDYVDAEVPGGLAAVQAELHHAGLATFFGQDFRAIGRYDILPLPYVTTALARLRRVSFQQQLRDSNRYSEARIGALYRALLQVLSAEMVAMAVPRGVSIAFDFGGTTMAVIGPRLVRGKRTGIPKSLVRWVGYGNAAYLELALIRSGAALARVASGTPVHEGASSGMELYSVPFEVSWA